MFHLWWWRIFTAHTWYIYTELYFSLEAFGYFCSAAFSTYSNYWTFLYDIIQSWIFSLFFLFSCSISIAVYTFVMLWICFWNSLSATIVGASIISILWTKSTSVWNHPSKKKHEQSKSNDKATQKFFLTKTLYMVLGWPYKRTFTRT